MFVIENWGICNVHICIGKFIDSFIQLGLVFAEQHIRFRRMSCTPSLMHVPDQSLQNLMCIDFKIIVNLPHIDSFVVLSSSRLDFWDHQRSAGQPSKQHGYKVISAIQEV